MEAGGKVCVATIINGGITAFDPDGSTEHFAFPDLVTTNICFGGAGHARRLGDLFVDRQALPLPLAAAGVRLNFNKRLAEPPEGAIHAAFSRRMV